jgi:GTPase Era involved in 16S rRNA processing
LLRDAKQYLRIGKSQNIRVQLIGTKEAGKKTLLKAFQAVQGNEDFCEFAPSANLVCQTWTSPPPIKTGIQMIFVILDASEPNEWTSIVSKLENCKLPVFIVLNKMDRVYRQSPTPSYVKSRLGLFEHSVRICCCSLAPVTQGKGIEWVQQQLDLFVRDISAKH